MAENQSLRQLLESAQEGDQEAFGELARMHRNDVRAFVASRLGRAVESGIEVDDLVQDTFLKALQGLDRFQWRGSDSLRRWLCGIAKYVIRNTLRKRSASLQGLSLDVKGDGPTPSRIARREERFDRLQEAVRQLSPDYRKVIELARIEGLKIHEIANRMNRSPGAVKQLLARALDQLKERFGDTASLSLPERALKMGDGEDA